MVHLSKQNKAILNKLENIQKVLIFQHFRYYTMDVATLFKKSGGGKYWALVSTLFLCHHPNNGFKEWNSLEKPHHSLSNVTIYFALSVQKL